METLNFGVNLSAFLYKLLRFFFHAALERFLFFHALLGGIFSDVFGDFHRTEVRTAHAAEVSELSAFLRQRLVVIFTSRDGIEAQVKLILPTEFESGLA